MFLRSNEVSVILNLLKLISCLDFKPISQNPKAAYIYRNIYVKLIFREVLVAFEGQQIAQVVLLLIYG